MTQPIEPPKSTAATTATSRLVELSSSLEAHAKDIRDLTYVLANLRAESTRLKKQLAKLERTTK